MGHLNQNAIRKLQEKTQGVLVTNQESYDPNCEVCCLTHATKSISRRPTPRSKIPYEKVHLDLIQMPAAYDGSTQVLHFQCDFCRMNHVYTIKDKSQGVVLQTIKDFVSYVRRRWGFEIKIFFLDGERSLGKGWENWIEDEGYEIQTTPPYTAEPNGGIERSGRTIITRSRALKEAGNLPEGIWPEIYRTAGYLINRSPSAVIDYETPYGLLLQSLPSLLQTPEITKPLLSHIRAFGCRAYALILNKPKLQRTERNAQVGYLVGYNSTNIYRIWVPRLKRVIVTRDVTFDETKVYDPSYEASILEIDLQKTVQVIELPDLQGKEGEECEENEQEMERPQEAPTPYETESTEQATHQEDQLQETQQKDKEVETEETQLCTPEMTPERSEDIVRRNEVYHATIAHPESGMSLHQAFIVGTDFHKRKVHRTDLPAAPKFWNQLRTHPHRVGFQAAATKEITDLRKQETFTSVLDSSVRSFVIPLMWVFTYKFDDNGYLVKYKARLVVRGDLQRYSIHDETYAATLASKTFRALMAITAYFDLDTEQLDAINAFTNSRIDEEVYVRCADGYEEQGKCWKLNRALYGLRRSPLLWFRDFSETLTGLGLVRIPEAQCLFVSPKIMVFFYVDDICILSHPNHKAEATEFRTKLMEAYEFREIGELQWFLGIRIIRDRTQKILWLCQDSYIDKITTTYGASSTRSVRTPMVNDNLTPYDGQADKQQIHLYQQKVGSVNYVLDQTLFTKHGYLNSGYRNLATEILLLRSTQNSIYFRMKISALYPLLIKYSS
jgi:hypothetical protein